MITQFTDNAPQNLYDFRHAPTRPAATYGMATDPLADIAAPAEPPVEMLKRAKFLAFVNDPASAALLHEVIDPALAHSAGVHMVNFRTCLAILGRMRTPETLLVDLSSEDQPLTAMGDLADVVEPGTTVMVIGKVRELSFYRNVVNGMGVREYLAKPLTAEKIRQHFLPIIASRVDSNDSSRLGRVVAVTGARGGVGASTIAANLAWAIGHSTHRHALLLDADLQTGTTALSLNVDNCNGLLTALETPDRIDPMLIERVVLQAGDRLHLLAVQEDLSRQIDYQPGSAGVLTKALRQRFNYIITDTGCRLLPFGRELLHLAHQRVIVLDPSMVALRNLDRLLQLPGNNGQSSKSLLVLNQAGRPGGLSQDKLETAMGLKFDIVIPDLPRLVPRADRYGDIAAATRGPFRNAILQLAQSFGIDARAENPKILTAA